MTTTSIEDEDRAEDLRRIRLSGRLDMVGLRCIIHSAKALEQKGGTMVLLLGDNTVVRGTLDTVGVSEIIPVFQEETVAMASLGG